MNLPARQRQLADLLVGMFERLTPAEPQRDVRADGLTSLGIAVGLALTWVVVYLTNGTTNAFTHAMYLPVIVASLKFGLLGGVVTALAAGVLMGPLMLLDVELGTAQPVENMLYRAAFFLIVSVTTAAIAGSRQRRHRELDESRRKLAELAARNLSLFAKLVAERDEQTGDHCERVAHNTVVLAHAFGVEGDDLTVLYWAGLLHDLGKLGVPEAILRKAGPLTDQEFEVVKRHPAFGEEILLDISDAFSTIAVGVRSHHERWDGSGYPDGLKGEAIPLAGRILALVDVFEAVTSNRPYRGPMEVTEALDLIQAGSGTHFDPTLVRLFLRLELAGKLIRELEDETHRDAYASSVIEDARRRASVFA